MGKEAGVEVNRSALNNKAHSKDALASTQNVFNAISSLANLPHGKKEQPRAPNLHQGMITN